MCSTDNVNSGIANEDSNDGDDRHYSDDNEALEEIVEKPKSTEPRNENKGNSPDSGINVESELEPESSKKKVEAATVKIQSAPESPSKRSPLQCPYCPSKVPPNLFDYHIKAKCHGNKVDRKLSGALKPVVVLERLGRIYSCESCEKTFVDRTALLKHDFECKHDCSDCDINFKNESNYKEHFLKGHKINLYNIPLTASSSSGVQKYSKVDFMKNFVGNSKRADHYYCRPCHMSITKSNFLSHLIGRHGEKPLKCPFCTMKFIANNKRVQHITNSHPSNSYKCKKCGSQSGSYRNFYDHMRKSHKIMSDQCRVNKSPLEEPDIPNELLMFYETSEIRNSQIQQHPPTDYSAKMVNKNEKIVKTDESQRSRDVSMNPPESANASVSSVLQQLDNMEEELTFEEFKEKYYIQKKGDQIYCTVCNKNMLKKNASTHAKSIHAVNSPFLCPLCPEVFNYNLQRTNHMAYSHPFDLYCGDCNERYLLPSAYASHMKLQHLKRVEVVPDKVIDLSRAEMRFSSKAQHNLNDPDASDVMSVLSLDSSISSKDKLIFTRAEFINNHCTDFGNEGIRCNVCDKKVKKSSISSHLVYFHAVQYPYKCSFCDKRYSENRYRNKHVIKHHPNGYVCKFCQESFASHVDLVLHTRQQHNSNDAVPKAETEVDDLLGNNILYTPNPVRETANKNEETIAPAMVIEDEDTSNFEMADFLETQLHQEEEDIEPEEDGNEDEVDDNEPSYSFEEFKRTFVVMLDEKHIECTPCKNKMAPSSIYLHVRTVHCKRLPYSCELCKKRFIRPDLRVKHMTEIHPNDFRCEHCDKQFFHSMAYKEHMLYLHKEMIDIPTLKSLEEIDPPIDRILFKEKPRLAVSLQNVILVKLKFLIL